MASLIRLFVVSRFSLPAPRFFRREASVTATIQPRDKRCVNCYHTHTHTHTHIHKDAWTVITHTHTHRCMNCYHTHTHTHRCMNCYSIHTHVHTHRMMRELLSIHMRTPIHTSASSLHSPGKARLVCI